MESNSDLGNLDDFEQDMDNLLDDAPLDEELLEQQDIGHITSRSDGLIRQSGPGVQHAPREANRDANADATSIDDTHPGSKPTKSGPVNGKPDHQVNSQINGQVDDQTNGKANGQPHDQLNGHPNGAQGTDRSQEAPTNHGDSKTPLEPYEWNELLQRFQGKMQDCSQREEELEKEFAEWIAVCSLASHV